MNLRNVISIIFSCSGAILACSVAYIAADSLGELQWILYGAGFLSIVGASWMWRQRDKIREETPNTAHLQRELIEELERREALIRKRQEELAQKARSHYQWMEFPEGIELPADDNADLLEKDQQVFDLLEKKTGLLFDKIKRNGYQEDGKFQGDRLVADISELITSVAKIYQPDSDNPLLETSIEKLLRALNRISLQLLVLFEQLPINLKEYNLKKVYETIQTSVKAYDIYKTAEPWLPYIKPVYYLGRYSLGVNPVTLGIGWAVGELLKGGAKKLSSHFSNRYALNLLHDLVFVIGSESAGIFGEDFRHRDANWIYGAELTELVHRFPLSRETLIRAMNEVSGLQLRSEYDRIFLYRCLAAHKSAEPEKFDAKSFLSLKERKLIAERLERFFKHCIHGSKKTLDSWKSEVEDRLCVKLQIGDQEKAKTVNELASQGLQSLAAFLIEIKGRNPEELPELLKKTNLFMMLDDKEKATEIEKLTNAPPMIFDYPDIDPSDKILDDYINDLISLSVRVFPYNDNEMALIENIAHYFRRNNIDKIQKEMDQFVVTFLAEKLLPESPEKKLKPGTARNLLSFLEAEEHPLFIYTDILIQDYENLFKESELWLIGTDHRLILIAAEKKHTQNPVLIWKWEKYSTEPLQIERIDHRLHSDCQITGGILYDNTLPFLEKEKQPNITNQSPVILLSGKTIKRYDVYFGILNAFIQK